MTPADCPICGDPSARGLATCLPCAGLEADGLVFARMSATGEGSFSGRLRSLLGYRGDPQGLELAARGHRAIAAVPLQSAGAVSASFAQMGIPVRIASARFGWAPLPATLALALVVMTVAGMAAGWTSSPRFLLLTPLMLVLTVVLAQIRLKAPIIEPNRSVSLAGSEDLGRMVAGRLNRLASGSARQRLARISGLARILDDRLHRLEDDQAKENLRVLVESAGPVAEELARLEELDEFLDEPGLADDPQGGEAVRELEERKARLAGALDSAAHILERAAQGSPETRRSAAELPALARAIESRIEAWDEVLSIIESPTD